MSQKGVKMKKQDWEKHQYGKNHTYDLTRMKWPPNLFESSSVLCECSPGTMVETVLHDSGDRSTVGSLGAEGSARMLMTYPLLSKTLQLTPLEGGSWGVRTNTFISIEDLTLVGEEVQVIGPLRGVGYSREEGWRGEVRFDEAPYSRGELPVGTVGMILSSVVVTPSKEFYGLSGGGSSWLRRNFYIVFVNTILDIVKGGYWLWPIQETRRFDSTKEIGINNFDIWNIHDRKKKLTLDSSF